MIAAMLTTIKKETRICETAFAIVLLSVQVKRNWGRSNLQMVVAGQELAGQEQRYHIFKRMLCCTADTEEKVKGHSFFRSFYGTPHCSICEVLQLKVFSQSRDGITMVSLDPHIWSWAV